MSFQSLGLSADLLAAVSATGYTTPTPIQAQAIPLVLSGRDLMASAQTGTGKTAAFTLPLLQRLGSPVGSRPRALILTPTRELATQVEASLRTYAAHSPLRSAVIFGGVNINPQTRRLKSGVDVIVATPGRLLDHLSQGHVDLGGIETFVLDEADRMLDMGFIRDIRRVERHLPARGERQTLLFSATFSDEILKLAQSMLSEPERVEVAPRNTTAERVEQRIHPVEKSSKRAALSHLIGSGNWQQVLVFTRTKHGANRLARQLERDGLGAAAIHGDKSQGARTRALQGFKDGDVRVLVATDIAARGIDIDRLTHVVNFELPNVPEDYVHRIGRTARAGRAGEAISLVAAEEADHLRGIEKLLGASLPVVSLEDFPAEWRPGRNASPPKPRGGAKGPQRPAGTGKPRRRRRRGQAKKAA